MSDENARPLTWSEREGLLASLSGEAAEPEPEPTDVDCDEQRDCRDCEWERVFHCYTGRKESNRLISSAEYRSITGIEPGANRAENCPEWKRRPIGCKSLMRRSKLRRFRDWLEDRRDRRSANIKEVTQ